jgi:hypothetical protein
MCVGVCVEMFVGRGGGVCIWVGVGGRVCVWDIKCHCTVLAPLILTVPEIIFLSGTKHIMGHFKGFFEGAEIFLTTYLS